MLNGKIFHKLCFACEQAQKMTETLWCLGLGSCKRKKKKMFGYINIIIVVVSIFVLSIFFFKKNRSL